jgi:hypothetical protein
VPIVTSRAGGLPEAVQDGVTGILCPPGDVAALAAAIDRLAGDAACGRVRRRRPARILAEFSIDAMVDGNLDLSPGARPMKIITVLRSLKSGGAERHALQLMRACAPAATRRSTPARWGWLGQQLRAEGFGGIDLPLSGLYDLPSVVRLALYARRVGADLIHGHLTRGAWYAGLAARLAGCPMWPRPIPTTPASTSAAPTGSSRCPRRWRISCSGRATRRAHPHGPSRHRRHRRAPARRARRPPGAASAWPPTSPAC